MFYAYVLLHIVYCTTYYVELWIACKGHLGIITFTQ